MDKEENTIALTQEELDEILRNLPRVIKELETEFKEEDNFID